VPPSMLVLSCSWLEISLYIILVGPSGMVTVCSNGVFFVINLAENLPKLVLFYSVTVTGGHWLVTEIS
jgi:hypothetical protein